MRKVFNLDIYDICTVEDINNAKMWIRTEKPNEKGLYGYNTDAPQCVKDALIEARKKCGIIDNTDVLASDYSRFFVHFEDNEAWHGKASIHGKNEEKNEEWGYDVASGRTDWNPTKEEIDRHNEWIRKTNAEIDASEYDSDAYDGRRIMEILYKWFVKIGKLDPNSQELLEIYGKDRKGEWYTVNGKSFTYHDIWNELLTSCWHEG